VEAPPTVRMSRRDIYYWKCDRPAAFHGTQSRVIQDAEIERQLGSALQQGLCAKVVELSPASGQGNHLTWNALIDGQAMFIRVENGPEKDSHLSVESSLLDCVREAGVPTPRVFGCDATRSRVPFAWQALERIAAPDLNHWFKQDALDVRSIAFDIGVAVAKWQGISFDGFGALEWSARFSEQNESVAPEPGRESCVPLLTGSRSSYTDYFHLRLDEHLAFLVKHGFLSREQRGEIAAEIENHGSLLDLSQGCFVHKDLALWNILGTENHIVAFIDFDDSISGDPMEDLSLLACFHDKVFLNRAFEGYQSLRILPSDYMRRFWLHLLRNMIVKSVIRVGAGYFERDDGFFLIGNGSSGSNLREMTHSRLALALAGLRNESSLTIL
jgi:hypothetical protein